MSRCWIWPIALTPIFAVSFDLPVILRHGQSTRFTFDFRGALARTKDHYAADLGSEDPHTRLGTTFEWLRTRNDSAMECVQASHSHEQVGAFSARIVRGHREANRE